jgi:pilus assembly protein Flp/PilA
MPQAYLFLKAWIATRASEDRGATMVEYGLLVAFIALIALAGVILLGEALDGLFTDIAGRL